MAIEQAAWGALGFLNFTRAHFAHYQELLERYADCQLCLVDEDDRLSGRRRQLRAAHVRSSTISRPKAGIGSSRPPPTTNNVTPQRRSARSRSRCRSSPLQRPGARYDQRIPDLAARKRPRRRHRAGAPVRKAPATRSSPMADYVGWNDEQRPRSTIPGCAATSPPADKIIKPADRSMVVEEPVGVLGNVARQHLRRNLATYKIDGALMPVSIELEKRQSAATSSPTCGSPTSALNALHARLISDRKALSSCGAVSDRRRRHRESLARIRSPSRATLRRSLRLRRLRRSLASPSALPSPTSAPTMVAFSRSA